jgi:hypothetical protein
MRLNHIHFAIRDLPVAIAACASLFCLVMGCILPATWGTKRML